MSTSTDARDSARVAERFRCRRHDVGEGVVRVSVAGELDRAGAAALTGVLCGADTDAPTTVLDLDELTLIEFASASALRAAAARARRDGRRLIAVNARPDVERSLRLMGIDRQLKLVSTRNDPGKLDLDARRKGQPRASAANW
jgi:anti-anti-sigma factor